MTHFTLWNEKCLQSKRRRWTYARYDGTHFEFVLCDELCRVSCMWLFVRVVSVFLWFVLRWLCFGMWKEETATRASMVLCMENLTHLSFRFILFSAWPGYHNNWRNCSSVLFLPMSQFRKNHNFYHTFGREISREYHTGSDDWHRNIRVWHKTWKLWTVWRSGATDQQPAPQHGWDLAVAGDTDTLVSGSITWPDGQI